MNMNMLDPMHVVDEAATPYATAADLFKTFTEEMHSLYLLSLLLTADNNKAEQCFVSAMGECLEDSSIFVEWTRSRARRAILKYAIRMIMPVTAHADRFSLAGLKTPARSAGNDPLAAILALDPFERFVFVISVLEGRSEQECAILLRSSRRDIMIARVLALKRLANSDASSIQANEWEQA
jgi:hypothetical protein